MRIGNERQGKGMKGSLKVFFDAASEVRRKSPVPSDWACFPNAGEHFFEPHVARHQPRFQCRHHKHLMIVVICRAYAKVVLIK